MGKHCPGKHRREQLKFSHGSSDRFDSFERDQGIAQGRTVCIHRWIKADPLQKVKILHRSIL